MQHKFLFVLVITFLSEPAFSQPTSMVTSSEKKFNEAKEYFMQKQFALAYPLLKELHQQYPDNRATDHTYINEDIAYYYTVCGLLLQLPVAEQEAGLYLQTVSNEPRRNLLNFYLGKYYFTKNDYENTVSAYAKAGIENLSNDEIADLKFELGYSYFYLKKIPEAKPLFNEIHQLPGSRYYIPANYYYGFIAYFDHQYADALEAFRLVESQDAYRAIVPYYIAEILYFQKKKEDALTYAEAMLNRGGLYYDKEMKQLAGQIYFENSDFTKALPLLEYYYNNSDKVTRENLYELSYCYYQGGKIADAARGFRQLSNDKDSLGQHSMYLLADCYLKTGEKENARNAFQFCSSNSSNKKQQEISLFNYAKLSYDLGYQDIALKELQRFIQEYKSSAYLTEAREILVNLLAGTNNFTDALSLYSSFEKPSPSMQKVYPKILYGRAVELINEQQSDMADELLAKIQQLPPSTVSSYASFWRGEIACQRAKYDDAIRFYNIFLQANVPAQGEVNPASAKYNIGFCWMKKEMYRQALALLEPLVPSVTPSITSLQQDALIRSADCYFMLKDFSKAGYLYDAVIRNALAQSDYAVYQKALIAGISGSAEKIKVLMSLVKQYPSSSLVSEANMEIANTYMADEQFKEALPFLSGIITSADGMGLQPRAYLKSGICYYNMDNNNDALNNFKQLIQKYPLSAEADEAVENIRNIYIEENRPNEFVDLMRRNGKILTVSEADSITYTAAELKYNSNDCTGAITGFSNYLQQYPSGGFSLQANYYVSVCYEKNKNWTSALAGYNYVLLKGLNRFYERSAVAAARINYFELKNYSEARKNFESLKMSAVNPDNQMEALRGLVRCYYQLKDYKQANETARELISKKGANNDDKAVAYLVLGKSQQADLLCDQAITSFKSCAAINRSAWGAEARYEIAVCYFSASGYFNAEKSALAVIKETGSYDYWVTKAYILLGDIYYAKKDLFNAKATYESVANNAVITELKTEARQKLDKVIAEESANSKIN